MQLQHRLCSASEPPCLSQWSIKMPLIKIQEEKCNCSKYYNYLALILQVENVATFTSASTWNSAGELARNVNNPKAIHKLTNQNIINTDFIHILTGQSYTQHIPLCLTMRQNYPTLRRGDHAVDSEVVKMPRASGESIYNHLDPDITLQWCR